MSPNISSFDTRGMGVRAAIPSINTNVKLARGTKSEMMRVFQTNECSDTDLKFLTAAAFSAYPRDRLLGLAGSPLAVSSVPDPERLRKYHDILTAGPSPSAASTGQSIKGESMNHSRHSNMRKGWGSRHMGMSAVTPTGTFGSFESLIRPASEMQVMTPEEDDEAPINITFASLNLYGMGPGAKKEPIGLNAALSPEAREFVPTNTPASTSNMAAEAVMGRPAVSSNAMIEKLAAARPPVESATPAVNVKIDAHDSEAGDHEDVPLSSVESVAAKNGHHIPSRPTLCALPPNLPRWAHKSDVPVAKRPQMIRNSSSSSMMTSVTTSSVAESGIAANKGLSSPWRRQPTMATSVLKADNINAAPSQPQPIQTENLSPDARSRPSSAVRVGSALPHQAQGSARSWGIPAGSMASPARVPKLVTPTGLLGAVPMQGAGYK